MEKLINVICPSCYRITEKREIDFIYTVIQGEGKETIKEIKGKDIKGIEFCAICR